MGGEVELSVPEKEMAFKASVEAGDKTLTCPQDVTYYKPCRLSGLPEGMAHVHITGTSTFDRDIPVSADGRTSVQILHRGHGQEVGTGVMVGLGGIALVFGLTYAPPGQSAGLGVSATDTGDFLLNVLMVTLGGSLILVGLPGMIAGSVSAHDGLLIDTPGKASEMARGPKLEWGGPLEPTTFRF